MDFTVFERQHEEILRIAAGIKKQLNKNELSGNHFEAALALGKLAGLISEHLYAEDKFLYPDLLNHPNAEVQATASRFISEMGDMAKTFTDYKTKFMKANKIKNDPEGFIAESEAIITGLEKRIEMEEKELYPLLISITDKQ